ncbi:CHAT domain-containing protein [Leptodontidium sp. MPI-SDFR-AT-0119]|nr:CHAT domain-containing protein [Leptodontidium sp. MPI-SDFR-AT-0119]
MLAFCYTRHQTAISIEHYRAISRQVLARATNTSSSESSKEFKVAVFGNPTPEHKTESKMAVETGEYLKADIFIGENATSHALLAAMQEHKLIHYHGHADFHSSNILEESVLKLNDGNVTVKKLFESPILQSPHITLVACKSGQQNLNIGDEPLGFFTALTVAGAGSVLGTLWELDDLYASSTFTESFYKDLGNDIRAGKNTFVLDLAIAHQKAAGIILYGSPWLLFNSDLQEQNNSGLRSCDDAPPTCS